MSDLTEFLLARIDEDEAGARSLSEGQWRSMRSGRGGVSLKMLLDHYEHKRRFVRGYEAMTKELRRKQDALAALASMYNDHPDYDEAWRSA